MGGARPEEGISHAINEATKPITMSSINAKDLSKSDLGKGLSYSKDVLDHHLSPSRKGLGGQIGEGMRRINEGLTHNLNELGKGLHTLVHGEGDSGDSDTPGVTRRSAFGQSKKPRKKKKGLLALQTPSAKAARFRAGKRRFRVRPTGKTGVSTGARSSGVSVPKG
jgi:hypothetical protein